jgi:hypothetical protein
VSFWPKSVDIRNRAIISISVTEAINAPIIVIQFLLAVKSFISQLLGYYQDKCKKRIELYNDNCICYPANEGNKPAWNCH